MQPAPAPDPFGVTATPGRSSATVGWDVPVSAAAVTGFEITRTPGGQVQIVPGDARTYRDRGLDNGTSYTYAVRTLTADGPSAAVAAPPVIPATVPTAPRIVSVLAGPRRVTVSWSRSQGRGRPITAYRLTSLGRTLEIDPGGHQIGSGRYRATLTGLPVGRRLRVAVRARNDVGWSRTAYTGHVITGRRSP